MIAFNRDKHQFSQDGASVPSVTQILDYFPGLRPKRFYPEEQIYRNRGDAVHQATELIDQGRLDRQKTHPVILGYVKGYEDFMAEFQPKVLGTEQIVFCEDFWYAGILDRHFLWPTGDDVVLDIKTSENKNQQPPAATSLQTVAYAYAIGKPFARRFALTLSPTGSRLWPEYNNKQDVETWLCMAKVYNYIHPRKKTAWAPPLLAS